MEREFRNWRQVGGLAATVIGRPLHPTQKRPSGCRSRIDLDDQQGHVVILVGLALVRSDLIKNCSAQFIGRELSRSLQDRCQPGCPEPLLVGRHSINHTILVQHQPVAGAQVKLFFGQIQLAFLQLSEKGALAAQCLNRIAAQQQRMVVARSRRASANSRLRVKAMNSAAGIPLSDTSEYN